MGTLVEPPAELVIEQEALPPAEPAVIIHEEGSLPEETSTEEIEEASTPIGSKKRFLYNLGRKEKSPRDILPDQPPLLLHIAPPVLHLVAQNGTTHTPPQTKKN